MTQWDFYVTTPRLNIAQRVGIAEYLSTTSITI